MRQRPAAGGHGPKTIRHGLSRGSRVPRAGA